jgi:hypothetical protein
MKKRYTLFFVLLFSVGLSQAQPLRLLPDSAVDQPGSWNHSIQVEAWADQSANTVDNEMLLGLIQGGFLDRDLRQRNLDGMQERNSFGYDLGARISWTGADSLFGKARWRPMVSAAYREVLGARFTKDVFALAFFGNAAYEDSAAALGGSAHTNMRYQTLGFGIADRDSRSYLRVDFVNGQSINASDLVTADVYTGVDGRILEAEIAGEYWNSDTAGNAIGASNGIGLAVSGRWSTWIHGDGRPLEFSLGVDDLGFVQWNERSVRLEKDSLIAFEGLFVDDLFDLDGVLGSGEQLLDTFGLRYTTGAFRTLLPFRAHMAVRMLFGHGWQGGFNMQQVNLPGFVPQFSLVGAKRIGQRTLLGGDLTAGGFGGIRFGFGARIGIGQHVVASLYTPHLLGFFLDGTSGLGANASLSFNF